jgi:hypothetical protein
MGRNVAALRARRRSLDCGSRDEAAKASAQDDGLLDDDLFYESNAYFLSIGRRSLGEAATWVGYSRRARTAFRESAKAKRRDRAVEAAVPLPKHRSVVYSGVPIDRKQGNITIAMNSRVTKASCIVVLSTLFGEWDSPAIPISPLPGALPIPPKPHAAEPSRARLPPLGDTDPHSPPPPADRKLSRPVAPRPPEASSKTAPAPS